MGRLHALRQGGLALSRAAILAAAMGAGACGDGHEGHVAMSVTATAELQSDRAFHVEGTIDLWFPPADAGPSRIDDAEVIVDPRDLVWMEQEPREVSFALEGGDWPVVRGDAAQSRTIRFSATFDIDPALTPRECAPSIELDIGAVLATEQGWLPLNSRTSVVHNTCAECDAERGDFAGIEDVGLAPSWETSLAGVLAQVYRVVPADDTVWALALTQGSEPTLVRVRRAGGATAWPTEFGAAIAPTHDASVVVVHSSSAGLEVSRVDAVGEDRAWLTSIEAPWMPQSAVAIAGDDVFIPAQINEALVVNDVLVDPAPPSSSLWLILDARTGAVVRHAPGFHATEAAPVPGGGFAAVGVTTDFDLSPRIELAMVEPDLTTRWNTTVQYEGYAPPRLAVGMDGSLYVLTESGTLHQFDASGNRLDTRNLSVAPNSTLGVGPDGTVFIGSETGALRIDDPIQSVDGTTWEGLPWCPSLTGFAFGNVGDRLAFFFKSSQPDGSAPHMSAGHAVDTAGR